MSAKSSSKGGGSRANDPPAMVPPSRLKSPGLVSRVGLPGQHPEKEAADPPAMVPPSALKSPGLVSRVGLPGQRPEKEAADPPAMVPPSALKSPPLVSRAGLPSQRPALEYRFFQELKRRNVLRVGVLYIMVCWLLLAPIHVAFNMLELPKWAIELVLAVMAGGFAVALGLAWAFELTPSGVKPTMLVDPRVSLRRKTGRKLDRVIIVVLSLLLIYLLVDKFWPTTSREQAVAPPIFEPRSSPAPAIAAAPASPQPTVSAPAQAPAVTNVQSRSIATIVDGQVHLIRGAARFSALGGVQVEGADIVTTGPKGFVQLEYEGGAQVALGPQTQLMPLMPGAGSSPGRAAYLLTGWVRVTADPRSTGAFNVLRTPLIEVSTADNVSVTRVAADETDVFVESGTARLRERGPGAAASELSLKPGQFYVRTPGHAGSVSPQPSPAFVGQMPMSFRDKLPVAFDLVRNRPRAASPAPDFTYADVEAWLKSEIGPQLAERWKDRARDDAFRRAIEANLRELPEWEPVLHPPAPPEAPEPSNVTSTPP